MCITHFALIDLHVHLVLLLCSCFTCTVVCWSLTQYWTRNPSEQLVGWHYLELSGILQVSFTERVLHIIQNLAPAVHHVYVLLEHVALLFKSETCSCTSVIEQTASDGFLMFNGKSARLQTLCGPLQEPWSLVLYCWHYPPELRDCHGCWRSMKWDPLKCLTSLACRALKSNIWTCIQDKWVSLFLSLCSAMLCFMHECYIHIETCMPLLSWDTDCLWHACKAPSLCPWMVIFAICWCSHIQLLASQAILTSACLESWLPAGVW